MADRKKPTSHYFTAAVITATYAVLAVAWIFLSEYLLIFLVSGPVNVVQYQSLKDWGLLLISTPALFYLALFHLKKYSHYLYKFKSQRSEMRFLSQFRKSVIDNANIWINVLDRQGLVTVWNQAAEQISGYRSEEVLKNGLIWEWLYPDPDYRSRVRRITQSIIDEGGEVQDFETVISTKSGEEKTIAWSSRRFLNSKEQVLGAISIGRDITEQKRVLLALRDRETQLTTLMDNLPGMAYRCLSDQLWSMKFVSSGCERLTGYNSEALVDDREVSYDAIIHEADRADLEAKVKQALSQNRPFEIEYLIRRRDGRLIWVWEQGQAVRIENREYVEGIILDINQRKLMEQELERMATCDPLTGLYNRRELERQLKEELLRAQRYRRPLSILWLDIDFFKTVNDRYGHLAGDEVLREVSRLLQTHVRAVDYAARYGGEELVVVLPELNQSEAMVMGERLRNLVATTRIKVSSGERLRVTVSIGVASFPVDGLDVAELFSKADEAMYLAKRGGRNRVFRAASKSVRVVD
jgi:diguanylate cyclase (GGDEF)-like protein/PAS domain S-box-containing protein